MYFIAMFGMYQYAMVCCTMYQAMYQDVEKLLPASAQTNYFLREW